MRQANLEPAYSIIKELGGDAAVAEICGLRDRTTVYRWTVPKEKKGTGGVIPQKRLRALLAYADAKRIPIRRRLVSAAF